jgi:hypothetical protein
MSSIAHVAYPSQHHLAVRAELATQAYQHSMFSIDLAVRFAERIAGLAVHTLQRWTAARRQAVQDRIFWELALTDPRVMADLHAIQAHAELDGSGRGN